MRVAAQVMLTAIERRRLETWASARSTTVRLVERSKIVLMACAGMPNQAIAKALGIDQNTVGPRTAFLGLPSGRHRFIVVRPTVGCFAEHSGGGLRSR